MAFVPHDPAREGSRSALRGFQAALRALTGRGDLEAALNDGAVFFPLIGLLLGAVWVAADQLANPLGRVSASLAVLLAAALTTRGRPLLALGRTLLATMSPTHRTSLVVATGPANALVYCAGGLLVLIEAICLIELDRFRTIGLLFAPVLGRCSMVVLAVGSRVATTDGRRIKFAPGVSFNEFALASALTFAVIATATEFLGLLLVLGTATLSVALRVFFHAWIGGVSRTTVEAGCEATQLMTLALLLSFS